MKKVLHVLAIDDHGVVLEGYHSIFKNLDVSISKLRFTKANDCRSGYQVIETHKADPFDIAILDYSIPNFPEMNLHSGEDMAMLLRESMPNCKIVMMTMHKEVDIMGRILQRVNPEGFINKSDCTTDELADGIKTVLKDNTYYTKTISNLIKQQKTSIVLDNTDVKILMLLAKGIKNKNLGKYIPMSDSGIEKRKYRIKRLLQVEGNDEDLIAEARKQGYI